MISRHPFAASNAPGTCKWCGRKLRPVSLSTAAALKREIKKIETGPWPSSAEAKAAEIEKAKKTYERDRGKRGDYGDGHFCGLSCAYYFAVAIANTGTTLNK